MNRLTASAALAAAVLLAGAGCSAEAEPGTDAGFPPVTETAPPVEVSPPPMGHGEYEFTDVTGAGLGVLTLPSEADPEIEELRAAVGADPVTYLTAEVDNRQGVDSMNMYQVAVYTPEGEELVFNGADAYLDETRDLIPADADGLAADVDLYNQFIEVSNKHRDSASVGEKKRFVLVGQFPELPEEISRVAVYPNGGFDEVDAFPAAG